MDVDSVNMWVTLVRLRSRLTDIPVRGIDYLKGGGVTENIIKRMCEHERDIGVYNHKIYINIQ